MTSASLQIDGSEFYFAKVQSCASEKVQPRSIEASPIRYECTLREVLPISNLPSGSTVVLLDKEYLCSR
jgi:flavin reductase (DIM6/NTAB) family NADH-FMN oxidoreductase RutF